MKPTRTFKRGGIWMRSGGEGSGIAIGPASNAFLPNRALVLMKQHSGVAARCVVSRGEFVHEGTVVGRAVGPSSSNVHAPIPGIVSDIRVVPLPEGGESEAVAIALEGSFDRLGRRPERYLWKTMSRHGIIHSLEERGVIETESPGFPLHSILAPRRNIDLLILNAVASEPHIESETALLRDKETEIRDGIDILRKVVEPTRTVIAIEKTNRRMATTEGRSGGAAGKKTSSDPTLPEIVELGSRYPQDLPGLLLEAIDGSRSRGEGGVLIVRPSTAFAVYEAIVHVKPMLERYVTIAGGAVKHPKVLKARIGTSIGDLIEECGGFLGPPARLIIGGPFRGHAVHDLDVPVTKTTSAVLALTNLEVGRQTRNPCIRCGRCAESCPERLDPDLLYRLVACGRLEEAKRQDLASCTLCGVCGHICPSRVPLVAAFAVPLRELRGPSLEARV